ncbi:MAG: hypothetical protein DHS20C19_25480 [Acidimicrobiales bacterium]|nr:MAG: hypothetical protein DHS20C19_25480 [Acidimicrobiales bacterium]
MTATATRLPLAAYATPRLAVVGALAATAVATAGAEDGVVLCPFRRCTGAYCPGCGATRATNRLVRGDLGDAWAHHPAVVLMAAQLAVVGAILLARRRDPRTLPRWFVVGWVSVNAAAMFVVWAIRLGSGAIPRGIF